MITDAELPVWATLLTAGLIMLGATLTLIGSVGLLRLGSFYARMHAPTLGTTLGAGSILIASMVYFSVLQSRFVVHEVLIAVFLTVTTPVALMLLARASLLRDQSEGTIGDPTQGETTAGTETSAKPAPRS